MKTLLLLFLMAFPLIADDEYSDYAGFQDYECAAILTLLESKEAPLGIMVRDRSGLRELPLRSDEASALAEVLPPPFDRPDSSRGVFYLEGEQIFEFLATLEEMIPYQWFRYQLLEHRRADLGQKQRRMFFRYVTYPVMGALAVALTTVLGTPVLGQNTWMPALGGAIACSVVGLLRMEQVSLSKEDLREDPRCTEENLLRVRNRFKLPTLVDEVRSALNEESSEHTILVQDNAPIWAKVTFGRREDYTPFLIFSYQPRDAY